ncbi:uncharacterized protein SPAR_L00100 [Saccharomyces paradoxus]|uniref:Zn(2)-C6 fungal-type domain-containing protein n=1 Tax=Saccharomyces paradoxus TaxID=27291 RepID=A0A8B8UVJ4_SACPA|nr:uncharacterized protein SPAR_L00100 [Saccharomyces paradoxus]QHS74699.1 hypothetical protein SPAR_L00100 [Saccharomyces paradoxus]
MNPASRKKVKPSFVCLRCKQRKTKCDKLWPTCSKCKASSSICSYEVEPGRTNKSPTIDNVPYRDLRNLTPASISTSGSSTSMLNSSAKGWEMKNFAMNLWNAHDKLVVMNNTTIVDSPFAFHSILQHDLFAKALTTCIHGRILIDVERHRENVSSNSKKRELNLPIGEIGPLFFIDKAALKIIENTSKTSKLTPPIDFLYNTYDYEQAHPEESNEKVSVNILLEELSKYLHNKDEVDGLIVDFYKTIYPTYPLLEISLFEDNMKELLQLNEFNGYNIVFTGKDSRRKLETITILTIILAFSHRRLSLSINNPFKESFCVKSNNLALLAHKLLALMNVFQYVNEHTFSCLLYFFILRYLNPDQVDMYPTHSSLLNLKFLENVAIKLGLNEEPFQYTRYVSEWDDYPRLFNLRRKLWLGVQFLKFEISTPEGDSDILSLEYLRSFIKTDKSLPELFEKNYASTNNLDLSLMATAENIYHLHLSLQVLLTSCYPINGTSYLKEVLNNIDETKDFLNQKFPLILSSFEETTVKSLHINIPSFLANEESFDFSTFEENETFVANIIGYTCTMNVYHSVSLHFEKQSFRNASEFKRYYHRFTFAAIQDYLTLLKLVSEYFNGSLVHLREPFGLATQKVVRFSIHRLFIFQAALLVRLFFKKDTCSRPSVAMGMENDRNGKINRVIEKIIKLMSYHMKLLIEIVTSKLEKSYLGSFISVSIFRYIIYLVDTGALSTFISDYWKSGAIMDERYARIHRIVGLKWGLGRDKSFSFTSKLSNPQILGSLDLEILEELEKLISAQEFSRNFTEQVVDSSQSEADLTNYDNEALNQLMAIDLDKLLEIFPDLTDLEEEYQFERHKL